MELPYKRLPRAVADIIQHGKYIARDNPDAAMRFVDAVEEAFFFLAKNPEIGRLRFCRSAPGLRSWRVRDFSNYLIFYRVEDGVVVIYRVRHGAEELEYPIKK